MATDSTKGADPRLVAPIACGFLVVLALHQYNEYYGEMVALSTLRLVTLWIGVIMSWIASFLSGRKCESLWEKVMIGVGQCIVLGFIVCDMLYLSTNNAMYDTILLVASCVVCVLEVVASVILLVKMYKDKNTNVLYRHRVLLAHFPLIIVSAIV